MQKVLTLTLLLLVHASTKPVMGKLKGFLPAATVVAYLAGLNGLGYAMTGFNAKHASKPAQKDGLAEAFLNLPHR